MVLVFGGSPAKLRCREKEGLVGSRVVATAEASRERRRKDDEGAKGRRRDGGCRLELRRFRRFTFDGQFEWTITIRILITM